MLQRAVLLFYINPGGLVYLPILVAIPGPSSVLFEGAAAAAFLCHYYLLRTVNFKIKRANKCAQCREKNLSTGIRFKQIIFKGFLRLDLQPVQLIFPTSMTDKKSTSLHHY
jgi:hypothetical protein